MGTYSNAKCFRCFQANEWWVEITVRSVPSCRVWCDRHTTWKRARFNPPTSLRRPQPLIANVIMIELLDLQSCRWILDIHFQIRCCGWSRKCFPFAFHYFKSAERRKLREEHACGRRLWNDARCWNEWKINEKHTLQTKRKHFVRVCFFTLLFLLPTRSACDAACSQRRMDFPCTYLNGCRVQKRIKSSFQFASNFLSREDTAFFFVAIENNRWSELR